MMIQTDFQTIFEIICQYEQTNPPPLVFYHGHETHIAFNNRFMSRIVLLASLFGNGRMDT